MLTDDEVSRIARELPESMVGILTVALHTALRQANIRLMEWAWIRWSEGLIVVPAASHKNRKQHVAVMTPTVRKLLEGRKKSGKVVSIEAARYVFLHRGGRPYTKDSASQAFRRAAERAGVENATFHDLKHTCLTRMAALGASEWDVMFAAGHSDTRMTARYTHPTMERRREVAARMDRHQIVTTALEAAGNGA